MRKPTIALVYFNAGGGHRAAATALQQQIEAQGRPWDVRLVNLFEVLDPKRRFQRITGAQPEDIYNKRLAKGWTLGLAQELKLLQRLIRLCHRPFVELLRQHWLQMEPELVVSLVPNFNRSMCEALNETLPGVPYLTVMTDLADLPPNFWIEPRLARQHLVCGTPHALAQARAAGCAPERLTLASGMLLRPSFYGPRLSEPDRADASAALGLDPGKPTGIVMFGGHGSMKMLNIAKALEDQQLILVCGHNEKLRQRLLEQGSKATHAVLGFTSEVAQYMQVADYFIGKPGPGSLSEALHLGLPVVTTCGTGTLPQERYNAQWVRELGVGLVLPSMRGIAAAVDRMLARLPEFQAAVGQMDNQGLFEVPELFARLMAEAGEARGAPLLPFSASLA